MMFGLMELGANKADFLLYLFVAARLAMFHFKKSTSTNDKTLILIGSMGRLHVSPGFKQDESLDRSHLSTNIHSPCSLV